MTAMLIVEIHGFESYESANRTHGLVYDMIDTRMSGAKERMFLSVIPGKVANLRFTQKPFVRIFGGRPGPEEVERLDKLIGLMHELSLPVQVIDTAVFFPVEVRAKKD